MRLSIFFVCCCCCLLLVCGCSSSHPQANERHRPADANREHELTPVNAAMVEAMRDLLSRTQVLYKHFRGTKGTLFLKNVNPEVVNALKAEMELPQIEADCAYFHEFTDIRSGKWARIVQVRTVSADPESVVFSIDDGSPMEGYTILVEMRRVNGKWKVASRRITGIAER